MKKLVLAFAVLLLFLISYEYLTLPDISDLKRENPKQTALMRQRAQEAQTAGRKLKKYQIWVPYPSISGYLKSAILIGEDDAFYQHQGYDLEQIKESFIKNWEKQSW